jgi:hypothetical protein
MSYQYPESCQPDKGWEKVKIKQLIVKLKRSEQLTHKLETNCFREQQTQKLSTKLSTNKR